ncbi:MAG: DUF4398 domain-containing protein [Steroidobacter sp.]
MKLKFVCQIEKHFSVILLLTLLLAACASAPVQEMSDARQAVAAAVQSGAETAAPTEMSAEQTALKMAERLLRDRQFDAARHYARDAHTKALRAQQIAQSRTGSGGSP